MFNKIIPLVLLLLFIAAGVLYYKTTITTNNKVSDTSYIKEVEINGIKIPVMVADEPHELSKGLSGKQISELENNSGMLFILPEPSIPSFWMIDMNFPLDMIWIRNLEITAISKNVPAPQKGTKPSELPKYSPGKLTDHVLEVHAGFTDTNNIKVGDKFSRL